MGDKGFLEKTQSRENGGILEGEDNKEYNDFDSSDVGSLDKETENSNSKCVVFGFDFSETKGRYPNVENVGSPSKKKRFSASDKGKSKVDDSLDDEEEEKLNLDLDGLTQPGAEDREPDVNDFWKLLTKNAIDHVQRDVRNIKPMSGTPKYKRWSYRGAVQNLAKKLSLKSSLNTKKDDALKIVDKAEDTQGPFDMTMKMIKNQTRSLPTRKVRKDDKDLPSCMVPSLMELCLNILSKNSMAITSLVYVPDMLRHKLSKLVCDSRKMDAHFLKLLVEESPREIRVYNGSRLTEGEFAEIFGCCETKNLIVLQLDLCGSCIPDHVLQRTLAHSLNSLPALVTLSLNGAYRLTDIGLNSLAMSAPALQSINLSQCALLKSDGISNLAGHFENTLKELYLDDCQGIKLMDILPALKKLKCLEVLSVAGIHSISDDFVIEIVEACGKTIKELVFADCGELTDDSLKAVGKNCSGLCALDLSWLCELTDSSIRYLANGCRSIKRLKLHRNIGFSDEAIAAFLECSGSCLTELSLNHCSSVGLNTASALAKCSKNLFNLDLSWCRNLTFEMLVMIVADCLSLRVLKLFGYTHITDEFLRTQTFLNALTQSNKQLEIVGLTTTATKLKRINAFEPPETPLRY